MRPLVGLIILALAGCAPLRSSKPSSDADPQFHRLAQEFLGGYLDWRPQLGTSLGLHEYDGRITEPTLASVETERARLRNYDRLLAAVDTRALSPRAYYDFRLLRAEIHRELFKFDDQKVYTQNPMTYAGAIDVNIYIKRNFAPLENRVRSIIAIERAAPRIVAAGRTNLEPSLAKPLVQTAIDVAKGAADFLAKDLVEALQPLTNQTLLAEFKTVNQQAIGALRSYAAWLETEKLPSAHERYALGAEKFQRMLRESEFIDLPPERILELGLRELKREQAVFAQTARQIDPARPAIEVFKEIQRDHPTEKNLIPDTKHDLESIRQFLIDHRIITIPSKVRPFVEETPAFARATSFASMDIPGPFETKATEAYYYVTPVEPDWTPQQKEEWLTAFNYYTTDVVSIHEVYPGHYVQYLCLNASPANRLEKIVSSYGFVEGWAHYTEQMMLDAGFGAPPSPNPAPADRLKHLKYRLAQSDEALLRLCRLCVDIQVHCRGMSVEDGAKFFQDNCYYEAKPARQEATRAAYDPGYLNYTLGKLQILKLRRDYQAQEGSRFTLQRFHDELLRHGMPPIPLLRELMLKDKNAWPEAL